VSFVVAVREVLVAKLVRVTAAPATAAPDGSVTVPVIVPVETDCPISVGGEQIQKKTAKRRTPTPLPIHRLFVITLPFHLHLTVPERELEQLEVI